MDKRHVRKWGAFAVRWGIAVLGIWYVFSKMSFHDSVLAVLPGTTFPVSLRLAHDDAGEDDLEYQVVLPNGSVLTLRRDEIVNEPDKAKMKVTVAGRQRFVVGLDLSDDLKSVKRILVADSADAGTAQWVEPAGVSGYELTVPHPRVRIGIIRTVKQADGTLLLAALLIFPATIVITSMRWHELMKPLEIQIPLATAFKLNMVGLFYNTFMPGSTGGDVIKAYEVARRTHHRTRAVMSVLVDRIVGLVALIIVGGVMAACQWQIPMCRRVAVVSGILTAGVALGLVLFYVPILRKMSGLDWIIHHMPMQRQVHKAVETMHIYGRRPLLAAGALLFSFPVHIVVIISAMLCGIAFNLPIHWFYYWMAVPVIVLSGSIPISPQGAGVMEYFAIKLLEGQNVSVAGAFALTMSIRMTQIFWNLTGGYFVLRGGFHAPTEAEEKQIETEDQDHGDIVPEDPATPVSA